MYSLSEVQTLNPIAPHDVNITVKCCVHGPILSPYQYHIHCYLSIRDESECLGVSYSWVCACDPPVAHSAEEFTDTLHRMIDDLQKLIDRYDEVLNAMHDDELESKRMSVYRHDIFRMRFRR